MKLYKLTDRYMKTHEYFQWELNKGYQIPEKINPQLCSGDVFHAYKDLNLGLLCNPQQAAIENPRIFKAEGDIVVEDFSKCGCFNLELKKEIKQPVWYADEKKRLNVQVLFAVLCAEAVLNIYETKYPNDTRPRKAIKAARKYLKHPSKKNAACAASDAADAVRAAAYAVRAAAYASGAAADAVRAASYAARAASYAADAARAACAADAAAAAAYDAAADAAYDAAAAYASGAASYASGAAADAVRAAAYASGAKSIDFAALADQAVKEIMEGK